MLPLHPRIFIMKAVFPREKGAIGRGPDAANNRKAGWRYPQRSYEDWLFSTRFQSFNEIYMDDLYCYGLLVGFAANGAFGSASEGDSNDRTNQRGQDSGARWRQRAAAAAAVDDAASDTGQD